MPHSFHSIYFFFLLTSMAFELVFSIQLIVAQVFQGEHLSQNVVVCANLTDWTQKVTACDFGTNHVAKFTTELKATAFACGFGFGGFRNKPEVIRLMSFTWKTWWGKFFHDVLVFLLFSFFLAHILFCFLLDFNLSTLLIVKVRFSEHFD